MPDPSLSSSTERIPPAVQPSPGSGSSAGLAVAFASRAENLLMADIAIRSLAPLCHRWLAADLPLNSSRRRSATVALIEQMGWDRVYYSWYVKISLLPGAIRRLGGFWLEPLLRLSAQLTANGWIWITLLSRRPLAVDLLCGRPTVSLLLFCRLARPRHVVLLDTGPKVDALRHLETALRALRRLPSGLGGVPRRMSRDEAFALLSPDLPVPLLCWSAARYAAQPGLTACLQPLDIAEFVGQCPASAPLGDPQGPPHVFLIGKSDSSREDVRMMIRLSRQHHPEATPIYFLHPREDGGLSADLLREEGVAVADPGMSLEGFAMMHLRDIKLIHVFAVRQSQTLMTLPVLYGAGFGVTLLR